MLAASVSWQNHKCVQWCHYELEGDSSQGAITTPQKSGHLVGSCTSSGGSSDVGAKM